MAFWRFALVLCVLAEDVVEEEETEPYSIMKDVEITMVAEVLDGSSFVIKDKSNKPVTVHIGHLEDGSGKTERLRNFLQRSMILYRPFPDELQTKEGVVLADVWTAEGLHIGMALEKNGAAVSGKTTDYTMDILQVAAEQEKQKSYKELEKALAEQGRYEREMHKAAKEEMEYANLKGKDWLLVVLVVFAIGMFAYPVYKSRNKEDPSDKAAALRLKMAKQNKEAADAAEARRKEAEMLLEERRAKEREEREAKEAEEAARKATSNTKKEK